MDDANKKSPNDSYYRRFSLGVALTWLRFELKAPQLLKPDETIALAKKLICRERNVELTRAQVEEMLQGENFV